MSGQTIAILCGSLGAALLLIVVVVVVVGPLRRRQKQQRLERNLNLDSTERGDFESNDSARSDSLLIVADAATTPQTDTHQRLPRTGILGRGSISSSAADTSARNSISDSGILERRMTDRSTNSSNGRFNNYGTSIPTTPFSSPNAPTAPTDLVLPREKSLKRELKVDVVEGDVLERLKSQRAVVSEDAPKR
ncbi:hypothetical protein BCR33DRAFT_720891 [Rhizoclosmatium globosum]|uniref:Uncharacterized protein n=1 Tax=Rhizoclosmatium globosum TaxID=329046 RepID=A0A1Y2BVR2_9FUNG|nr:hypothetical protein BCR33DRAFT_720891 [Rhizoclosmatium globosum]|eukprot:ORY38185.1 hypothetical protein BCR33DRAFT_720891 [Rhizoclosmatium globosum]